MAIGGGTEAWDGRERVVVKCGKSLSTSTWDVDVTGCSGSGPRWVWTHG